MDARKPKDLPFYETPDHIKTSAKIISEAKSQLGRSQLRPIGTQRPVTPQEGGRKLFGEQSSRDPSNRPPSAFRSVYICLAKSLMGQSLCFLIVPSYK